MEEGGVHRLGVVRKEVDKALVGCSYCVVLVHQLRSFRCPRVGYCVPLSNPLISPNLVASSNLRKSLVFCARSFLCTVESRWKVTISDAVLSRFETKEVKSRPRKVEGQKHSLEDHFQDWGV